MCRVGLELPVELAGDVADQAAFHFAVGLAVGPPVGGVGAGGWIVRQPGQHDQVERLVEVRSPDRLSRWRTVWRWRRGWRGAAQHREGGVGAAAASLRPGTQHVGGHDRADAVLAQQVRPPPWTRVVRARMCSAISVSRSWMRRASVRRLAAVAVVSLSQSLPWRSCPQPEHQLMGGQLAKPAAERFGDGDHQGVQLALGVAGGLDRGAACRQPHR
jgi:hypothetical protein